MADGEPLIPPTPERVRRTADGGALELDDEEQARLARLAADLPTREDGDHTPPRVHRRG